MLTGKELGTAIDEAIRMKGVKKADVAREFGVKPPSVTGWIQTGRIAKEHLGKLVEYFSDVVSPSHFGMGEVAPPPPPRFADFAARLKQSIETSGLSLDEVAKKSFVPKERLEKYLTGTKLPYVEDGENLAEALKISVEWLRYGDNPEIPPIGSRVLVSDDPPANDAYFRIPIYDVKLSAGNGNATWIEREDDDNPLLFRPGWLKVKGLQRKYLRGMYVRGDSMEPLLMHWDTIVIDASDTEAADGEVYAVCYQGKLYIKELRNTGDAVQLVSRNPKYDPIEIPNGSDVQFQVLGRMVWRGG